MKPSQGGHFGLSVSSPNIHNGFPVRCNPQFTWSPD